MAETKYEPSGSHVSKAESDVAQTISLAGSIITLVREPVALVYKNVARGQRLKRSPSAWQPEAIDEAGRCRIPMLRGEEYERHLVATDGVVPAGQRAATPGTTQRAGASDSCSATRSRARRPRRCLRRVPPAGGISSMPSASTRAATWSTGGRRRTVS